MQANTPPKHTHTHTYTRASRTIKQQEQQQQQQSAATFIIQRNQRARGRDGNRVSTVCLSSLFARLPRLSVCLTVCVCLSACLGTNACPAKARDSTRDRERESVRETRSLRPHNVQLFNSLPKCFPKQKI